ncbi:cAMP-independent regulatory protein pac2 [Nosema bombycis CQ1]|uniref:cAMP-independent regulatory protein pac2 n=1 Tax=Nosema bombycis (strain CQ1 / CVCC 102059) TaxID=578461 RepID=R0MNR5_NOSB1|nr:cAMP-independent regulatory protein pac2 [Nosema bombycis CQ1]|eukprot:EOB14503.1 cAMP-independent regulatory protein pac2 [Nosema bombycis CQ1]
MNKLCGYIQTYEEAVLIVHTTRLGYLIPITQRLKMEERENLRSGDIFVFIESENGMKRWTDGKIWSPSKINGQFLLYKEVPRHLSKSAIKKRNAQKHIHKDEYHQSMRELKDDDKLAFHKKTISIIHQNKTYHIIGYFRPLFSKEALVNIPFFKQIDRSLKLFPELLNDDFLLKEKSEPDFHRRYNLPIDPNESIYTESKRIQLENIALRVLGEWITTKQQDMLRKNSKNG